MLFSGKGMIHLDGRKELTDKLEPIVLKDFEYVYIPLLNMNSTSFEVLVKEGDYVKVGQMIAYRNDHFYVPIFSSVSGTVEKIEKMMSVSLVFAQHIKIKNDFKFDSVEKDSFLELDNASKDEIVEAIKNNGITGRGGSGFPTYIKYTGKAKIHTLLINAVECEPYITLDYHLIKYNVDDFILGVEFLLKASDAKKAIIAFKKGKDSLVTLLNDKLKNHPNIEIKLVPDVYPMGWERTLVKEVFNQTFDKLPGEIGVIVQNSTTAIRVAQSLTQGYDQMVGMTFSGEALNSPATVLVPMGTKVSDVVAKIGGYKDGVKDNEVKLIMGGPMMGKAVTTDEVALVSYSNAANFLYFEELEELPCLRCGRCVEYCPSGLQSVAIKDAEIAKNVDMLKKLRADTCVSCGLCSYVCPSRIQVTDYTTKGKNRVLSAK